MNIGDKIKFSIGRGHQQIYAVGTIRLMTRDRKRAQVVTDTGNIFDRAVSRLTLVTSDPQRLERK